MFIKGIAIVLSSCRNVGAELIISKRATQSYFWVTLVIYILYPLISQYRLKSLSSRRNYILLITK